MHYDIQLTGIKKIVYLACGDIILQLITCSGLNNELRHLLEGLLKRVIEYYVSLRVFSW